MALVFFQIVEGFLSRPEQLGQNEDRFFDTSFAIQSFERLPVNPLEVGFQICLEHHAGARPSMLTERQVVAPCGCAERLSGIALSAAQRNGVAQCFLQIAGLEHRQHALHVGGLAFSVKR